MTRIQVAGLSLYASCVHTRNTTAKTAAIKPSGVAIFFARSWIVPEVFKVREHRAVREEQEEGREPTHQRVWIEQVEEASRVEDVPRRCHQWDAADNVREGNAPEQRRNE